jgi:hypothetical protein
MEEKNPTPGAEQIEKDIAHKEEEYVYAVRSNQKYAVLRNIRDEITQLKKLLTEIDKSDKFPQIE